MNAKVNSPQKRVTMTDYLPRQRVRIIKGNFTENLYGTYVGPHGAKMCRVIDGDIQQERNLLLTSIRPVSVKDRKKHGSLVDGIHGRYYTRDDISKAGRWRSSQHTDYMRPLKPNAQEMKDLLDEITAMRQGMERLELKAKEMTDD